MCGIAGIFSSQAPNDKGVLDEMLNAIRHRGPDASGVWSNAQVILGHRRLSIQDTSAFANQPMHDCTARFTIVFNGEIYNFKKLRDFLKNDYEFITGSDTEVILASWKKWGVDCLQYFEGMFAFALWDNESQLLYLVRDRFGEKPLYFYKLSDNGVAFSSELKSLLKHPSIPTSINLKAVSQFLSLNYILNDQCIIEGVVKLPAASYAIFSKNNDATIKQYWSLAEVFKAPKWDDSENDLINKFNNLFSETIQDCAVSDVPLGIFLSGGVDSSSIVAGAHKLLDKEKLKAFTIGFEEKSFNELHKAQEVADLKRLDHIWKILPTHSLNNLSEIINNSDEPFADTSMVPMYALSKIARENVTVCLSGDGGDELFGGYETYKADKLHRILRHIPFKKLINKLVNYLPTNFGKVSWDYKLKQFAAGLNLSSQRAHYSWRTIFSESDKNALAKNGLKDLICSYDPFNSFNSYYKDVENCDLMEQHYYVDLKTWMMDDILVKVDRMSMLHSLEVRAPFLNHKLAEWIIRLPKKYKMNGFCGKYFLKKSQSKNLPHDILYGRKEGFGSPVSQWITQENIDQIIENPHMKDLFNVELITAMWQKHKAQKADCGYKLFGLICLSQWLSNFYDKR